MAKTIESVASRAQTPFKNASLIDFTKPENRQAQMQALEQVKSELGQTYPLIIGGKKITSQATFASVNPSQPDQAGKRSRPGSCHRLRKLETCPG